MKKPVVFGIVGGASFRAQYYLRIARELPDRFRVSGLVVRDGAKRQDMAERWRVPVLETLEDLLERERPDFVVVSVSGGACPDYLLRLAELGVPALAETPPAPDLAGLIDLHERLTLRGARVQVAEQYHLYPLNVARSAIIREGRLGDITQATVSVSHLYHGVSLLRKMLGIGFEDASIRGMRFEADVVAGPGRGGPPTEEKIVRKPRDLAWLDYGGKLGIYDFTADQHRSWVRSNHLSVRGVRGEIFDTRLSLLQSFDTPQPLEFKRINRGEWENAEGYFLQGIMAGDRWVYENPYAPARLYDDELAIAACLDGMASYVDGGPSFYGLPEASQDCYLGYLIEEAVRTGETVTSQRQIWSAV
ncbi:Gfo/Idh/MocA family protein [Cohnella zeiphila]|uniref:Gfo/Idh/MocA family oxidoreductase n=1 Tax=Cohnella zeiphila TaxID=2761120 RepID=A0A7X0SKQ4_9BACL|nr:Gfo/Idh/MocA family oxidoreductase [Cohnella zeiphila]MBB6731792.1 Gfo/Idh/MocA family oxidoreductase [Cohnella zeiphila]